ncbi:MAG: AbrB/MazE/SpoVT family DNA-binding domain-containing protein [Candidatus Bathyarchaeia archaeon]
MTTVTRNFQVTIPKRIREKYGVKVGDEVEFVDRGSEIVLLIKLPEEEPLEAGVLDGAYEKLFAKKSITTDEIVRRLRGDWEA